MENRRHNKKTLKDALDVITGAGIQADRQQLKKDMRAQFANYREWIREYVVNAYDALATTCRIFGEENGEEITITVIDDGKGMNRERIEKFFTLYSSTKDIDQNVAIGTHGIGKLSIAAIPNQLRFEMETSDGNECWLARAGRLDSEEDISVEMLENKRPRGTTFRVTFKASCSLRKEMIALEEVLINYVRFLPFQVVISIPMSDKEEPRHIPHSISENWNHYGDSFTRRFKLEVNGGSYEVVMNLGENVHEVYQNKVLVSNKYNLLSHGLKEEWNLGNLGIRVNGSTFELPFGRHCLSDDEILNPLSMQIREQVLPKFMNELYHYLAQAGLEEIRYSGRQVEALTCNLLRFDRTLSKPWCRFEFIRTLDLGKLSFSGITAIVKERGRFFIEDESNAGIDYSYFSEPVLHHDQPGDLIALLKTVFKERCISLKSEDLVFEKWSGDKDKLSDLQKTFMQNLGFHPELFSERNEDDPETDNLEMDDGQEDLSYFGQGIFNEVEEASQDLSKMKWRVSYLVEKDFRTPSQTHLFIHSNNTIILNLYHPLIKKLVELSSVAPKLAGHWGISLCLEDGRNVFPYLSPDTREELLMLDGIAKLKAFQGTGKLEQERMVFKKMFNDFRKNLKDSLDKNLN
jgi:hypothetical protein